MTGHAGAHFEGFGEAAPLGLDLSPRAQAAMLARIKDGTWDAFATAAAHVGHCAHPIRLTGSTSRIDAQTAKSSPSSVRKTSRWVCCSSAAATAANPSARPARGCMPATPSR